MENNCSTGTTVRPSSMQAQQILQDLESDRATLAERLAAPGWLYPLVAMIVAGYVATPAVRSSEPRNAVVGGLIVGTIVVLIAYQRLSGVRVGRIRVRAGAVLTALLVVTLVLLSTSYGLVASLSAWWVLAPAAACFVVVLFGGRWFDRLYREDLGHGR